MARIDVNFNDSTNQTPQVGQQQTPQNQIQSNTAKYMIGQAVTQLGKRALQYGANQVGNITGNYLMQNQINNAVQGIGWASQLAVGVATGGAVGGIVSGLAITGEISINVINYTIELSKKNQQAAYLTSIRGGILNANSR